jgi:hypothetical protein
MKLFYFNFLEMLYLDFFNVPFVVLIQKVVKLLAVLDGDGGTQTVFGRYQN